MENNQATKKPRGFAAMDPTLVKSIASKGGKAAHASGTAHQFTTEEARAAGRKGGHAAHMKKMKEAGLKATLPIELGEAAQVFSNNKPEAAE
jgi:general stress protein YciG